MPIFSYRPSPTVRAPSTPFYQMGFRQRLRTMRGLGQEDGFELELDGGGGGGGGGDYGGGETGGGATYGDGGGGFDFGAPEVPTPPAAELPPEMAPPEISLPPEAYAPLPADILPPPIDPVIQPLVNAGFSVDDANYLADLVQSGRISEADWWSLAQGELTPDDLRQIYGSEPGKPVGVEFPPGMEPRPRPAPGGGAPGGGMPGGGAAAGGGKPSGMPPSAAPKLPPGPAPRVAAPVAPGVKRVASGKLADGTIVDQFGQPMSWWDQELIGGLPNKYLAAGVAALFVVPALVGGGAEVVASRPAAPRKRAA